MIRHRILVRQLVVCCAVSLFTLLGVASARADTYPGVNGAIVFASGHRDLSAAGAADLYLRKTDGTIVRLTATYSDSEYSPSFSPDGRSITFVKQNLDTRKADVWVMNSDGSNPHQITFDGSFKDGPTFSPDGTRIAYSGSTLLPFTMHIFSIGANGLFPWDHTPLALGVAEQPSYCPTNGSLIAYAWSTNGGPVKNVLVLNTALGLSTTLVAEANITNTNPNFSPNGKTLVYERHVTGEDSIRTIPVAGGTPSVMFTSPYGAQEPVYSPDSAYLLFSTGAQLETLQLSTHAVTSLGYATDDRVPSWGTVPH